MNGYLYILLAALIIFIAFMIFQAVGGKLIGGKIEDLGIFVGPTIFHFKLGEVTVRLNALPLGSYVKFSDDFQLLHPLRKTLAVLAGLVSYLVLAFIGLGFAETFQQVSSGFVQILSGVISPVAVGSRLVEVLANVFQEKSFPVGLGILASKLLAFNLIPVGSLSGGMIVLYLLELFNIKSEKLSERYNLIGLLFVSIVTLVWIFAFVIAFWRNSAS
jgi:hypothetical protein